MSKVLYTAVVLDEHSREKLIKYFKAIIPENFEIIAHHMTINLGDIDPEIQPMFEKNKGINIPLMVNDYAINDKVIAVGVSGFPSKNNKPHITIAVNRMIGATPKMSNELTDWKPLKRPFMVVGKPTEIIASALKPA
jgi:hypothetical protein